MRGELATHERAPVICRQHGHLKVQGHRRHPRRLRIPAVPCSIPLCCRASQHADSEVQQQLARRRPHPPRLHPTMSRGSTTKSRKSAGSGRAGLRRRSLTLSRVEAALYSCRSGMRKLARRAGALCGRRRRRNPDRRHQAAPVAAARAVRRPTTPPALPPAPQAFRASARACWMTRRMARCWHSMTGCGASLGMQWSSQSMRAAQP